MSDVTRSRVFRAFLAAEVLVTVAPGREVTVHEDMITLDTDDGERGRVEFDALIREAINEADFGPDLWTVPGYIEISAIEELTT